MHNAKYIHTIFAFFIVVMVFAIYTTISMACTDYPTCDPPDDYTFFISIGGGPLKDFVNGEEAEETRTIDPPEVYAIDIEVGVGAWEYSDDENYPNCDGALWLHNDYGYCNDKGTNWTTSNVGGSIVRDSSYADPSEWIQKYTLTGYGIYTITGDHDGWEDCDGSCTSTVGGGSRTLTFEIPTPTPTNTPTPTPTCTPTPTPTPAPELVLTKPRTSESDIYISAVPAMPGTSETQCKAKVENYFDGEVTFTWTYKIKWIDCNNRVLESSYTGTTTANNDEESSWSPNFGNDLYGGDVTVTVTASGNNLSGVLSRNSYKVLAMNPSDIYVRNYINSGTNYWYAERIGKHETGEYDQFINGYPLPNASCDGGYGIFQLTNPTPTDAQHWNWKANVDGGLAIIESKTTYAKNWMISQTQQYNDYNSDPNVTPAPTPINTTYVNTNPTYSITFSYNQGNDCPYYEAVAIKKYNGALHNYLSWDDVNNVWDFNKENIYGIDYVERVCKTIP